MVRNHRKGVSAVQKSEGTEKISDGRVKDIRSGAKKQELNLGKRGPKLGPNDGSEDKRIR